MHQFLYLSICLFRCIYHSSCIPICLFANISVYSAFYQIINLTYPLTYLPISLPLYTPTHQSTYLSYSRPPPHPLKRLRIALTVVKVSPSVVGFDDEVAVVQNSEAVDDVGTDRWVDVLGLVFAFTGSVPGPVGEVTHDHVVSCGREGVRMRRVFVWKLKQWEGFGGNAQEGDFVGISKSGGIRGYF